MSFITKKTTPSATPLPSQKIAPADTFGSVYTTYEENIGGCKMTATPAGHDVAGKPLWKIEVVATNGRRASTIAPLRAQFGSSNFNETSFVRKALDKQLGGALSAGSLTGSGTVTVPSSNLGGLKTGTSHSTTVYASTTSVPEGENVRKFAKGSRDNATALKNTQLFGVGIPVVAHSGELLDKINDTVGSLKGVPTLLKKVKKDIIRQYKIITLREKGNLGNYLMGGYTGVGEFSKGVALSTLDTQTRMAFPGKWHDQIMAGATHWADEQDTKYYAKIKELGVDTQSTSYTLGNHGAKIAGTMATVAFVKIIGGKLGTPKINTPKVPKPEIMNDALVKLRQSVNLGKTEPAVQMSKPALAKVNAKLATISKKIIATAKSNLNKLYAQDMAVKLSETEPNSFSHGYGSRRDWNRSKNINPSFADKTLAKWADALPDLTKDQTLLWYKQVKIAAEKAGLSVADVEAHFPTCYNNKGVLDIPLAFRKAVEWKQATKDVKLSYNLAEPFVTPTSGVYVKGLSAQDIVNLLSEQIKAFYKHMPNLKARSVGKNIPPMISPLEIQARTKIYMRALQQENRPRTYDIHRVSVENAAKNIKETYELCTKNGLDFNQFLAVNNTRIKSAIGNTPSISPERAVAQYLEQQANRAAGKIGIVSDSSSLSSLKPNPALLTRPKQLSIAEYPFNGEKQVIKYDPSKNVTPKKSEWLP
jgi:hypothetical protein